MSPSEIISIFVLLYAHLLAPTLPGPIESLIQNPLVKILGLFWLVYERTRKWKFSLLIASGVVAILEGSCYFMYGRETFCNFRNHRWCPEEDVCYDETNKSEKVAQFLDDTDNFIKHLSKFLNVESPDAIEFAPKE